MNPMKPLPFYRGSPGYVDGSDTSEEAALSVAVDASSMRSRCLELIAQSGTRGMTCDEVEQALGWRHQTVSARLRELVLMEQIKDSGARRNTRSGRAARVYRVVERRLEPAGLGGLFA